MKTNKHWQSQDGASKHLIAIRKLLNQILFCPMKFNQLFNLTNTRKCWLGFDTKFCIYTWKGVKTKRNKMQCQKRDTDKGAKNSRFVWVWIAEEQCKRFEEKLCRHQCQWLAVRMHWPSRNVCNKHRKIAISKFFQRLHGKKMTFILRNSLATCHTLFFLFDSLPKCHHSFVRSQLNYICLRRMSAEFVFQV